MLQSAVVCPTHRVHPHPRLLHQVLHRLGSVELGRQMYRHAALLIGGENIGPSLVEQPHGGQVALLRREDDGSFPIIISALQLRPGIQQQNTNFISSFPRC